MFLNENDINSIKGLLHYLNNGTFRHGDLRLDDLTIVDSNGEAIAKVGYRDGEYGVVAA